MGRRLNREEWIETVQAIYDAYAIRRAQPKKSTAKLIDDEWLKELEANPSYAGIDIRRELGKAQAWAGVRNAGVTRMRFINWLNKVDRPITYNGSGATSFAKLIPKAFEPAGWREWVKDNARDPSWADHPWSDLDSTAQKYIIAELARGKEVQDEDHPGGGG